MKSQIFTKGEYYLTNWKRLTRYDLDNVKDWLKE